MKGDNIMKENVVREYIVKPMAYNIERFLERVKNYDILLDPDVQRKAGQFTSNMKNELIYTVLTNDHIPDLIAGEEESEDGTWRLWLIDGLQRVSVLDEFRHGNYRITKDLEQPLVCYTRDMVDENGNKVLGKYGTPQQETVEYDLRRKTYDDLPVELKLGFNDYMLYVAIHKNCSMDRISQLIRRYNNHTPMNTAQKAFTQVDKYAKHVKYIIRTNPFFKDCGKFTNNDRQKGGFERMIVESCMLGFHPQEWKKQMGKMSQYLNENGSLSEFDEINELFKRLIPYTDQDDMPEVANLFTSKDTFLWIATFNRFIKLGLPDQQFGAFLKDFASKLDDYEVEGTTWGDIKANGGTKDKAVVENKLEFLTKAMLIYFKLDVEENLETVKEPYIMEDLKEVENESKGEHNEHEPSEIPKNIVEQNKYDSEESGKDDCIKQISPYTSDCGIDKGELLKFVRDNVRGDIEEEDLDCYIDSLDDLITLVDNNTELLEPANRKSLLAIVAYGFEKDLDLDDWFVNYFENKTSYLKSQEDNFIVMQASLEKFNGD